MKKWKTMQKDDLLKFLPVENFVENLKVLWKTLLFEEFNKIFHFSG